MEKVIRVGTHVQSWNTTKQTGHKEEEEEEEEEEKEKNHPIETLIIL